MLLDDGGTTTVLFLAGVTTYAGIGEIGATGLITTAGYLTTGVIGY